MAGVVDDDVEGGIILGHKGAKMLERSDVPAQEGVQRVRVRRRFAQGCAACA